MASAMPVDSKKKKKTDSSQGCLVIPETTGNDMRNYQKRSEMTENDVREDFCLSVCVCVYI